MILGEDVTSDMSVSDWSKVLEEGCEGDQGIFSRCLNVYLILFCHVTVLSHCCLIACPALIRKYGKAMGGALVDFVNDGEDAEEVPIYITVVHFPLVSFLKKKMKKNEYVPSFDTLHIL